MTIYTKLFTPSEFAFDVGTPILFLKDKTSQDLHTGLLSDIYPLLKDYLRLQQRLALGVSFS
jgi:hypothetical protein